MTEHLTKETFLQKVFNYETHQEWAYSGDQPCVIDFWAEWCGPCRAFAPVFEELSTEYAGKVAFYKVDTEAEQELAAVFGIRSIPSILFIPKNGKPQMAMGALPKCSLHDAIEEVLMSQDTPATEAGN
jgi:thioredoxin